MSHRNPLGKFLLGDDKIPGAWQRTIGSNVGPFAILYSKLSETRTNRHSPLSFVSPKTTLSHFRSVSIRLPTPQFCSGALSQARVFGADLVQLFFF